MSLSIFSSREANERNFLIENNTIVIMLHNRKSGGTEKKRFKISAEWIKILVENLFLFTP